MRIFLVILLGGLLTFFVVAFFLRANSRLACALNSASATIFIDDTPLKVIIADTYEKREQGLSDTVKIPYDGMLFVFLADEMPEFWMKDMNYSIDIVWISADGTVVEVVHQISPDTFPDIFSPSVPIRYALELNGGRAEKLGITSGSAVDFKGAFKKNNRLRLFDVCEPIAK